MIEPRLLERINTKKEQLDALRPLSAASVARLRDDMVLEWTYNSNAIEGNTLTLSETHIVLRHGLTVGGKTLVEHLEVINHRDAIDFAYDLVKGDIPISPYVIREIHALVLARIMPIEAGRYRQVGVRISHSAHVPPEPVAVPAHMDDLARWLNGEAVDLHPVIRAALAHHRFVAIHPFADGNGRTGRLLMNVLLMRDGYPPAVIERVNRTQYYTALAQADAGNQIALVNYVARAVERSLTLYITGSMPYGEPSTLREPRAIYAIVRDSWVTLAKAAAGTPYSQEYLSLLARKGQLDAVKRGRNWYTTREAVAVYRDSVAGTT